MLNSTVNTLTLTQNDAFNINLKQHSIVKKKNQIKDLRERKSIMSQTGYVNEEVAPIAMDDSTVI